jgi:prevent-host-death family protein
MKIASVADMKAHFSAYLKATEQGAVIVTRNGKPVAALVPVADEDEAERLAMAYSPKLQAILDASRQQLQAGAGIPHDEFWRQVEAESRAAKQKEKQRRGLSRRRG